MIDPRGRLSTRFFAIRYAIAVIVLVLLGCTPPTTPPTQQGDSPKAKSDTSYPLRIVLVESDLLQPDIELSWQAFSDQGLIVQTMARQELAAQETSTADVLIYPANLMGTLVARDWISPVPKQVRERMGGWGQPMESSNWPDRWRSLSMYGGKPMAVPLGAPCWVAITRSLDISPLQQLHERILGNELNKETSEELWNEFLSKAESTVQDSLAEREADLQRRLGELTPAEKRNLVCRYLWVLSSTESRYRGLFDTHKLVSRCNQPDFVRAAIYLRRLGVLQPSTIFASPTDAWQSVAEGPALFGLGWPRTDNEQRLSDETGRERPKLLPIACNDGSGLMASIGGRTRQSANATQFLLWLASKEQRISFQAKTPTVELLEIEDDRNRVREDYREYQTLQRSDSNRLPIDLTPRFLEADQFVGLLEDALIDVFKGPESALERLSRCRQDSDALVEQLGREKLRTSLEAASGYTQ